MQLGGFFFVNVSFDIDCLGRMPSIGHVNDGNSVLDGWSLFMYTSFVRASDSTHILLAYDIHENLWMEIGVQVPKFLRISQLVVDL